VATVTKIYGVLMTLLGAFVGGVMALRWGVMRILMLGALLSALSNLLFAWLSGYGHSVNALIAVVSAMVEFTAPVFWGFLFLVGLALLRLRQTDPDTTRPFKVPLYPLLPLIFCAVCAWLTYSSVTYAISQKAIHVSMLLIASGVLALLILSAREKTLNQLQNQI